LNSDGKNVVAAIRLISRSTEHTSIGLVITKSPR